jgi:hypothetical protein
MLIPASPSAARDASSGAIYVSTLPTGADAWVDGAYVGRTPVLVDALAPGKHTITAAKTGWENRTGEVMVDAKLPFQFVDFQLERGARAARGFGKLALRSQVQIGELTVDGAEAKLGPGGTLDLTQGPHEIAIKTPRGKIVRRVAIYTDTVTNVVLRPGTDEDDRTSVIAPAARYLPPADLNVEGRRLTIRHNGHFVTGTVGELSMRVDGSSTTFDSAPTFIDGKLYLPLELFVRIGAAPLQIR